MTVINADCRDGMSWFEPDSIDAIVTDPPYELNFMGRGWDNSGIAYDLEVWRQAWRVLKPGGHLLAFSGSRTYHRMVCAIEDAGFEIRDQIMWLYGSGFPKSHDVSKAIDREAGAVRAVTGIIKLSGYGKANVIHGSQNRNVTDFPKMSDEPATPEAARWQGWGTALKPAHEPIVVARKPLRGTVAANVLAHGTGAINVDGCRVPSDDGFEKAWDKPISCSSANVVIGGLAGAGRKLVDLSSNKPTGGRWPANVIHDGSAEVVSLFPDVKGQVGMKKMDGGFRFIEAGDLQTVQQFQKGTTDSGSAARFFYCSKASKADRDEGLEDFDLQVAGGLKGRNDGSLGGVTKRRNHHPTVKPTDLMRYLCRLITPPHGTVLDPFAGSGSTGKAAVLEGFEFVGFELSEEYTELANARIEAARRSL